MSLIPGARLGPYEIVSALGAGGMGEVYKARDTRLNRVVALKVVASAVSADAGRRELFEQRRSCTRSSERSDRLLKYHCARLDWRQAVKEPFAKEAFMSRHLAVVPVIVVMCSVGFAQSGVDKTLMDLEQQWTKAALASKGESVAPLLTTDFISVQSDGTIQKRAEYLASLSKGKWQINEVSDMNVQVHGDSAVVTGVWMGRGVDGTGRNFDGKERFTDTWVKMSDGKWQCVADANAPIKK